MGRVNYSGLVVAGIGFFLTRFTVTLAFEDPVRFYLAGVVPLSLGLGLAAFGVALTVADVDHRLVRTTAVWCVVGAGTMAVLVVLTLLGSSSGEMPALEVARSRVYLSNFLIGGSVGGTLTGLYASRTRSQRRRLRRQASRLEVLNGLLRHEVLNALTAIRGYAAMRGSEERDAQAVIADRSDAIEETIEKVRYLTDTAGAVDPALGPVSVGPAVAESVETVRGRHPEANVDVDLDADLAVTANDRLSYVFTHLVENAVVHTDEGTPVAVRATTAGDRVRVTVADEGAGLPERERRLLESGEVGRDEGPGTGFGLYFVRFIVESYGGTIETEVDGSGTRITVSLPRADGDDTGLAAAGADPGAVRPSAPHLVVVVGAALVAGALYGVSAEVAGGSVSVIGVFYGIQDPVVGWLTHQFHSVVFGFVFAGLVTVVPRRYRDRLPTYVAVGTAWGLALWLVAAGLISAVWLRLLGIPASLPNLSLASLVGHLVWGPSLGVLIYLGYRRVTPRVDAALRRIGLG